MKKNKINIGAAALTLAAVILAGCATTAGDSIINDVIAAALPAGESALSGYLAQNGVNPAEISLAATTLSTVANGGQLSLTNVAQALQLSGINPTSNPEAAAIYSSVVNDVATNGTVTPANFSQLLSQAAAGLTSSLSSTNSTGSSHLTATQIQKLIAKAKAAHTKVNVKPAPIMVSTNQLVPISIIVSTNSATK